MDSSGLSSLSLSDSGVTRGTNQLDIERQQAEEEEMAKAMKEVERLRLEMQRAQERIQPRDLPEEGTVVSRKKKTKARVEMLGGAPVEVANGEAGAVVKMQKTMKLKRREADTEAHGVVQPKDRDHNWNRDLLHSCA